MPTVLIFYLSGLVLSTLVGFALYAVIGGHVTPLLSAIFGKESGYLWARSFRILLVVTALIGGLSVQWYGCGGVTNYGAVASDPREMARKTSEQVSGAASHAARYLLGAAILGAVTFAVVRRFGGATEDAA